VSHHWFAPGQPLAGPLERMVAQLQLSTTGCLIITVADDELTRREVVAELGKRLFDDVVLSEFEFTPEQLSLAVHLRRLLPPTGPSAILAYGLSELSPAERAQAIQHLNVERETLRDAGYSVALWVDSATVPELTFKAPDFWAWRSGVCEFKLDLSKERGFVPSPLARLGLAEADRLRRLKQLYEEQVATPPPNLSLAAELYLNLSKVYKQLAEPEERVQELRRRAYQLLPEAADVPMGKVFLSSTWVDLQEHRRAVIQALERLRLQGHDVQWLGMEAFGARDEMPTDACLQFVEQADIYVGIFGVRYGSRDPRSGLNMTEIEYRHAVNLGRPRLLFVIDEERASVKPAYFEKDAEGQKLLRQLKADVLKERVVDFFTTPEDLAGKVVIALLPYWEARVGPARQIDVDALRTDYLAYLSESCCWLNFRGILQMREVVRLPTEQVFVPLKATPPAELQPDRMLQEAERIREKTPIQELLPLHRRLVILGDPGAGKTTFLRYVALALATGTAAAEERLGVKANWLPVLFPITAYAEKLKDDPDLALTDYLPQYFKARELPDLGPLFQAEIERGNCLFLLDGLDEVGSPGDRLAAVKRVADLARRYPKNRIIVTSRIAGYHQAPLADDFVHLTIQPFDDEDINRFAQQWCQAYETLYSVTPQAKERARQRAEWLVAEIHSDPNIVKLAANPLLLSILALIHYQGTRLPHQRVELYRLCVEALAETWNRARGLSGRPINLFLGERPLDERFVVDVLGPVAFWMHEERPERVVDRHDLERLIARRLQEHEQVSEPRAWELADDFIRLMTEKAGLLVARGLDLFGFLHLTFEEYLAARYLVEWLDYEEEVARRVADPRWDEVIRLGAACLRGRYVARLVGAVLGAGLKGEVLGRDVVLAGQCALDVGPRVAGGQVMETLTPRLVETMQGLAVPIRTRADAGEVLDELGWLPEDLNTWMQIPNHESQITNHKSVFYVAKYPVTNAQYARFIEAGGYENSQYWLEETGARQWWEKEGREQGQPWLWDDPRLGQNRWGYPVVGVTWYEALAYCRWLTELLRCAEKGETLPEKGYELIDGLLGVGDRGKRIWEITLPSEAEWVQAAGGEEGDRYPWDGEGESTGHLPENERLGAVLARVNVKESDLGGTTPIAMYPAGASPYGVMDMAGNVWEWTRDPWEGGSPYKAVRGGSWWSGYKSAGVSSRDLVRPDFFAPRWVSGLRPVLSSKK
jgi:formylglycine-generating enzyme required for sulfatase activity